MGLLLSENKQTLQNEVMVSICTALRITHMPLPPGPTPCPGERFSPCQLPPGSFREQKQPICPRSHFLLLAWALSPRAAEDLCVHSSPPFFHPGPSAGPWGDRCPHPCSQTGPPQSSPSPPFRPGFFLFLSLTLTPQGRAAMRNGLTQPTQGRTSSRKLEPTQEMANELDYEN